MYLIAAAGVLVAAVAGSALITIGQRRVADLTTREGELERIVVERDRTIQKLDRRVSRDTLTGLASRDGFVDALEASLKAGNAPSLALLDLKNFKSINDSLGRDAGDLVLRDVARRLRAAVKPDDQVARFGGDQFAILFDGDVEEYAQLLLDALQHPLVLHGREVKLSVSIGLTTAKAHESVVGDLLREADVAMFTAKSAGDGWACYRTGMSALLLQRMDLHAQLVDALRDIEIVPWFQPVVDLVSGRMIGFEALARWCRSDEPVRDPYTWLPLAEETGLIVSVDRAMVRAAVAQLAEWRARYAVADLSLALNLSPRTLQQPGIAEEIVNVLSELSVPPDRLTFDVAESVLIEDERVSARLQILRAAGVKVALDNFGTGWSSLGHLQRFPVDQLNLDRTFTAELVTSSDGDAIPATVLQLATALRLDVVAEGVETEEQRARLIALGFRTAQGFLFGRPMSARVLESTFGHATPAVSATGPAPSALVG